MSQSRLPAPRPIPTAGPWLPGIVLVVVLLALELPVVASIVPNWFGFRGFYGHGLLVLALAGQLAWKRRRLASLEPQGGALATLQVLTIIGVSMAGLAAWAADLLLVEIAALWSLLLLGLWTLLGRGALRWLAPPFALLLLALPIWAPLQLPLQSLATTVVDGLLDAFGILAFVEGNTITVANGTFEIEGGCSGLGFLLASLTLAGYLVADARPGTWRGAAALAMAVLLALAANWLRILLIVVAGNRYGMDHWLVHDHVMFGWVIYSVLFLPFVLLLAGRLPAAPPPAAGTSPGAGPSTAWAAVVICAALLAPAYARVLDVGATADAADAVPEVSEVRGFVPVTPAGGWQPTFAGAGKERLQAWRGQSDGQLLWSYSAYYPEQRQNAEVVNRMNDLAGPGWTAGGSGPDLQAAALTAQVMRAPSGERRLVWSWYRVGDRHAGSAAAAKLAQVVERLRGRRDARITAIASACSAEDCGAARSRMAAFVAAAGLPRAQREH